MAGDEAFLVGAAEDDIIIFSARDSDACDVLSEFGTVADAGCSAGLFE
jgi:hypothetical protein